MEENNNGPGRPSKITKTKKQIHNYLQNSEIDRSMHQIIENIDASRGTAYKARDQLLKENKITQNRKIAGTPLYTNNEDDNR